MLLTQLKDQKRGPVKVYMPTGNRDADGNIINDPETGKPETFLVLENVYYRPYAITPRVEAEINEMSAKSEDGGPDDRPVQSSASLMRNIVCSWDCYADQVAKDANKPLPLTEEGMQDVPASLIYAIISACTEAQKPPKGPQEKSPSSFSTEES